jgi:PAS domain-containing protein
MHRTAKATNVRLIAIPKGDSAFSQMAEHLHATTEGQDPAVLERRLRRTFPRAVVRSRALSGETPVWYVYRDGGWRPASDEPWWEALNLPRLVVDRDGWVVEANLTALGLLEIERGDLHTRHYTDFVAAGALPDSMTLFRIVDQGHELTATILLRPGSGRVIAADLHASRVDETLVGVLRLADDVEVPEELGVGERPLVLSEPRTDAAFRGYVELALSRMVAPTPDGLALRLRRLYPHADVQTLDGHWLAKREPQAERDGLADWWTDPSLPWVRYDAQALILAANQAAESLLGSRLVGHYWQEFVTPGSTEQVSAMLAILAEVGRAESRFRMPRADGSLIEFDSYTEVDGEDYTTIMRPRS